MNRNNYYHDPNASSMSNEDSMSLSGYNSYLNPQMVMDCNYYNYYPPRMESGYNPVETPQLFPNDYVKYGADLLRYMRRTDAWGYEKLKSLVINEYEEEDEEFGRTTPLLYNDPHSLYKLDVPGVIYSVTPKPLNNKGAIIQLGKAVFDYQLLECNYPGPLDPDRSFDDDITNYLQDQIAEIQDSNPIDWDNGELLIRFFQLLIKENGRPSNQSVIKLLNEGVETRTSELRKECKSAIGMGAGMVNNFGNPGDYMASLSRASFSRASSRATSRMSSRPPSPNELIASQPEISTPTGDNVTSISTDASVELINNDTQLSGVPFTSGPQSVASLVTKAVSKANIDQKYCASMDKFRMYVYAGRFEEAIRKAADCELWDHAFALAQRLNKQDVLDDVLKRFCRRAIFKNDPLFTMHELLSSKMPKIASDSLLFSTSEMNTWRSHLSMMLSVEKWKPNECRSGMEALGDKLISSYRDYYAGHLCYLLARTRFGPYTTNNRSSTRRRLELIGWNSESSAANQNQSGNNTVNRANSKRFGPGNISSNTSNIGKGDLWRVAPELNIRLTEIYEYGLRLSISRKDNVTRRNNEIIMNSDELITNEMCTHLSQHLANYKYAMIYRMLSCGKLRSAYLYCKEISRILSISQPQLSFDQIKNVLLLTKRLYYLIAQEVDSSNDDDIMDQSWWYIIENEYKMRCKQLGLYIESFDMAQVLSETSNQQPIVDNRQKFKSIIERKTRQNFQSSSSTLPPPIDLPTDVIYTKPNMKNTTTSSVVDSQPQSQHYPQQQHQHQNMSQFKQFDTRRDSNEETNSFQHSMSSTNSNKLFNSSNTGGFQQRNQFSQNNQKNELQSNKLGMQNQFERNASSPVSQHKDYSYQSQQNNYNAPSVLHHGYGDQSEKFNVGGSQQSQQHSYGAFSSSQPSHGAASQPSYGASSQPSQGSSSQPSFGAKSQQPGYSNQQQPPYNKQQTSFGNQHQSNFSNQQQPSFSNQHQSNFSGPSITKPSNVSESSQLPNQHSTAFKPQFTPQQQNEAGTSSPFDMFDIAVSRSRTQSTTSIGSNEQQQQQLRTSSRLSRSRNNSESKPENSSTAHAFSTVPGANHLEKTVEEPIAETNINESSTNETGKSSEDSKQENKYDPNTSSSNEGRGWLSRFFPGSKSKEVHLPDDSYKPIRYDPKTGRYIDTSNPDQEEEKVKPPTMNAPPPNLDAAASPLSGGNRYALPNTLKTVKVNASMDMMKMMPPTGPSSSVDNSSIGKSPIGSTNNNKAPTGSNAGGMSSLGSHAGGMPPMGSSSSGQPPMMDTSQPNHDLQQQHNNQHSPPFAYAQHDSSYNKHFSPQKFSQSYQSNYNQTQSHQSYHPSHFIPPSHNNNNNNNRLSEY